MRIAFIAACFAAASVFACHADEGVQATDASGQAAEAVQAAAAGQTGGPAQANATGQVDVAGLIKAGDSAFEAGEFDKAIESYEQALTGITDDSLKADVYHALSSVYLEKGVIAYYKDKDDTFYNKAMEYANMCLAIKPQSWRALANKGVIYMNTGNYVQSDEMFAEAEKHVEPDSPYFKQLMDQHAMVLSALKLKELYEKKQEDKKAGQAETSNAQEDTGTVGKPEEGR